MKLLEKVGLIGIGYILKDCGAFYPNSRRPSYNGYFNYSNSKKSPGEKIKKMLTDKLTTVMEKALTPELIKHDRKPMSKNEPDYEFLNEITYSEFLNEHDDYLKESISIYKDYVVDENYGGLMEHPGKLIGEENYQRICKNMSDYDWGAYYIRNDELATDFEVTVYNENYAEWMGAKKSEKHEVKIESLERDKEDFE